MTIKKSGIALAALGLIGFAAAAMAEDAPARAEIPFANHGGIDNWKADGTHGIIIVSRLKHYYRAEFMSPCTRLPFVQTIGFVTDARDTLDKFDSIIVDGQHCVFKSFDEIAKPDKF